MYGDVANWVERSRFAPNPEIFTDEEQAYAYVMGR
jgi:hypothetical protein